jgi:hypothetical protein
MRVRLLSAGALGLLLALTSCSTGPRPPQPGTPGFYWAAARETWHAGDILKTNDNLQEIVQTPNDYTAKARVWQMAITAGVARGMAELGDAYEAGARANRANPTPFRKQVNTVRSAASNASLQFAQLVHSFIQEDKDAQVALAFDYPVGTALQPANLKKLYEGFVLQDAEAAALQNSMLQRGVLMALSDLAGSADETAKMLEKFKAGNVTVPREVFLIASAKALYAGSALFGPTKLDHPQRFRMLTDETINAVQAVPESKEGRALIEKVKATGKKPR